MNMDCFIKVDGMDIGRLQVEEKDVLAMTWMSVAVAQARKECEPIREKLAALPLRLQRAQLEVVLF